MRRKETNNPVATRPVPFFLKDEKALLSRIPFPTGYQQSQIETALRERIKELNCLYGIFKLAERHQSSLDDFLQELANFLPHAWQYVEKARARITFRGRTYASDSFQSSRWRQAAQIPMNGELVGECAIFYIAECPPADEGPFLKEERILLDTVAEQIGNLASRISADEELQEINQQLKLERQALQETNTALKVVLSRSEHEKQEVFKDIRNNVDKILTPIVNSLAAYLQPSQKTYINLLMKSLEEIASPFVSRLARACNCLSPTEISISNMIKNGLTTKEIAGIKGIATATVNRHRENIRRKLGITNRDVNLATFLQSNLIEPNQKQNQR